MVEDILEKSLVASIFNITWCACSNRALSCDFLIVVKIGLISKSFSKGMKSRLKSDTLSNMTLRRRGYLISHVLLKNWLTTADELSIYSSLPSVTLLISYVFTLTISNQPIVGSIIVIQVRLTLFLIIATTVCCFLIELLQLPIRSTCTVSHVFIYVMFLGGRCS